MLKARKTHPMTRAERVRQRRRAEQTRPRSSKTPRRKTSPEPRGFAPAAGLAATTVVNRFGWAGALPVAETPAARRALGPGRVVSRLALREGRWLSALVLLLSLVGLYALLGLPTFQVHQVQIEGLERLPAAMLRGVLPLGRPTVMVDPAEVARLLTTTFPGLAEAQAEVTLTGGLRVRVLERQPVLVWVYRDSRWWVDPQGALCPIVGEAGDLPEIQAAALPPGMKQSEGRWSLPPDLVQALLVLSAYVPQGQPLVYDAHHGLGWRAPEGWQVFVGKRPTQMAARMQLYWALRDYLLGKGLRPALIDLSVLDAPYFRMEP